MLQPSLTCEGSTLQLVVKVRISRPGASTIRVTSLKSADIEHLEIGLVETGAEFFHCGLCFRKACQASPATQLPLGNDVPCRDSRGPGQKALSVTSYAIILDASKGFKGLLTTCSLFNGRHVGL